MNTSQVGGKDTTGFLAVPGHSKIQFNAIVLSSTNPHILSMYSGKKIQQAHDLWTDESKAVLLASRS